VFDGAVEIHIRMLTNRIFM